MPALVSPDVRYRSSFLAMMAEFADEGRTGDDSMIGHHLARYGDTWAGEEGFAAYVAALHAEETRPSRPGFVCQTTLWWAEGEELIGRLSIRHRLTEELLHVGGHIGYDVRRSRRREGHATAMLAAALPVAHALGIDPTLVTCDVDNVASRKVIEANGGRLEDQRHDKLRLWVPTS
ncbi:MAG TPA: GNAT family N-acetyltransferase [Marmoricola sp.]|nr:GNAT family N-acetyltransferase [Marmoricola sp.]